MTPAQSNTVVAQSCRVLIYLHGELFDATARFYREILGLPIYGQWKDAEDRGFMFDLGAFLLEVIDPGEPVPRENHTSVSARVDNVVELWHWLSQTYSKLTSLRRRPWGDTDFAVYDPSGFHITFFTPTSELPAR